MLARALASCLFVSILAAPSVAQTVVSLDGSRCYNGGYQYWLTGSGMVGPHSQLLAQGYTVQPVSFLDTATLANASVCVAGLFNLNATLAPSEATDLAAWVSAGGGLLFIGENDAFQGSNIQFVTLFNAGTYGGQDPGFGTPVTIAAPSHPTISGPFGTVTAFTPLNVCGKWTNPPAHVTQVATNTDGSGAVIAFDYGAGRVVMVNDVNFFCHPPSYTTEHAEFWDNVIDWLSNPVCTGSASGYCTPSTSTNGCVSSVSASGTPSVAASSGFVLTCSSVEGQKSGIFFYGILGQQAQPWALGSTSFLCVKSPVQRTIAQNSGGTFNACDGSFSLDFLAYMAAHPTALGQPMTAGQAFDAQAWFRDPPAPKSTNLSAGLHWQMCP
jgi:hypothetical protein